MDRNGGKTCNKKAPAAMRGLSVRGVLVRDVRQARRTCWRELVGDLGDGASGASLLASAATSAGILVDDGGYVLELQNAAGAGVDADATGDALIGINNRMCHGSSSLLARRNRRSAPEFQG